MTIVEARSLFRTLTGESDAAVLTDSTGANGQNVDTYLQLGVYDVSNRLGGYYQKDGTVTITDAAHEFAAPSDFLRVLQVWHNDLPLKPTTQEELIAGKINWKTVTKNVPTEWHVTGTSILFYPRPSTAAVNADATPDVRYFATPPAVSGGFTGLLENHHYLPVYYAAALFIELHNDAPEQQAKAERLLKKYETGLQAAAPSYGWKDTPTRKAP